MKGKFIRLIIKRNKQRSMGNKDGKPMIDVEYVAGRGGGDKSGEDYFTGMFDEDSFSKFKGMYDAAP